MTRDHFQTSAVVFAALCLVMALLAMARFETLESRIRTLEERPTTFFLVQPPDGPGMPVGPAPRAVESF